MTKFRDTCRSFRKVKCNLFTLYTLKTTNVLLQHPVTMAKTSLSLWRGQPRASLINAGQHSFFVGKFGHCWEKLVKTPPLPPKYNCQQLSSFETNWAQISTIHSSGKRVTKSQMTTKYVKTRFYFLTSNLCTKVTPLWYIAFLIWERVAVSLLIRIH